MHLKPIGFVRNGITACSPGEMRDVTSQIIIDEKYVSALAGIQEYSHIYILFWFHRRRLDMSTVTLVHPRGRADLPLVGIFAARSQARPNPIGLTLVELQALSGRILTVCGLDAIDGTPVIDIKPPSLPEMSANVRFPDWTYRL